MDWEMARKPLLLISVVSAAAVSVLLLISVVGAHTISVPGIDVDYLGYEEGNVVLKGGLNIESGSLSEVSDLDIDLYAYNPDIGSSALLLEAEGVTVKPNGSTEIPIDQKIPFWTLFNIVNGDLTSDGSILHLRVLVSLNYAFGLVSLDADAYATYRLAADGKIISYSFSDPDDYSMVMYISGLHEDLLPDDAVFTITDGSVSIEASIAVGEDGTLVISASSTSGLDYAIDSLRNSDAHAIVKSGTWNDSNTHSFLTMLHYAREIQ